MLEGASCRVRLLTHAACFLLVACVLMYPVLGVCVGWERFTAWPHVWWPVHAELSYWLDGVLSWTLAAVGVACLAVLWHIYQHQSRMLQSEATAPLDRAGLLSRATFWWVMPTLKLAHAQGKLDLSDMPELAAADDPGRLHRKFAANCKRRKLDGRCWWSLCTNCLFHTQRAVFLQSLLLGWLFLALMFLDPIILNMLLNSIASPAPSSAASAGGGDGAEGGASLRYKFGLVGALSLSMLVRVTCMEMCYFTSVRTCNNARSTLVMAIFAASLDSEHSASDTGRLTNLMATDADKFGKCEWLVWFVATFTFALVSIPAVIYMLYALLGTASLVGFATLMLSNSSSTVMYSWIHPVVQRLQERRDERGQVVSGLLQGMRLVKLQGCQDAYLRQVGILKSQFSGTKCPIPLSF